MAETGESERNNFKAGIFTILTLVLGFSTLIVLNGQMVEQLFGKYNRYSISFDLRDGVSGLNDGSEVRVGGLTRGRVTGIRLTGLDPDKDESPEAIVDIEVDTKIDLWSNAVAIRTVPILGGSSWINITTVGGADQATQSPDPRNGEESILLQKAGQRNPPYSTGGGVEKRAPGEFQLYLNVNIASMMHGYSRVINSSRLRAVRATATQAAASGAATPLGR